ncbi:MAG: nucleoside deaminase [Bdellovibrionota bacterium]
MLTNIIAKVEQFAKQAQTQREHIYAKLFEASIQSAKENNYPVAAVIINEKQEIISLGRNQSFYPQFASGAHAEINAVNAYEQQTKHKANTMITTLEPCLMCTSRLTLSTIEHVYYMQSDPTGGGISTMATAPADFKNLASKMTFQKIANHPKAQEIASMLYNLGEQIWQKKIADIKK